MSSPDRAVRIPRARAVRSSEGSAAAGPFRPNSAGRQRVLWTFALYLGGLVAIYLAFLGLTFTAPSPGVRDDLSAVGAFSAVFAGLAIGGFLFVVPRAPRGLRQRGDHLVIVPAWGAPRSFAWDEQVRVSVLHRYPEGLFAPGASELVRIVPWQGRPATFLLEEGLLPPVPASARRSP